MMASCQAVILPLAEMRTAMLAAFHYIRVTAQDIGYGAQQGFRGPGFGPKFEFIFHQTWAKGGRKIIHACGQFLGLPLVCLRPRKDFQID